MAKLTQGHERMRKAVRRLNACVDVEALHRSVKEHWPVVNKMLEDGQLYLDGDLAFCFAPVGAPRNNWIECAPRPKDLRRAYPPGMMLPDRLREHEKQFTKFNEWMCNQHHLLDVSTPEKKATVDEWNRILGKMNELFV